MAPTAPGTVGLAATRLPAEPRIRLPQIPRVQLSRPTAQPPARPGPLPPETLPLPLNNPTRRQPARTGTPSPGDSSGAAQQPDTSAAGATGTPCPVTLPVQTQQPDTSAAGATGTPSPGDSAGAAQQTGMSAAGAAGNPSPGTFRDGPSDRHLGGGRGRESVEPGNLREAHQTGRAATSTPGKPSAASSYGANGRGGNPNPSGRSIPAIAQQRPRSQSQPIGKEQSGRLRPKNVRIAIPTHRHRSRPGNRAPRQKRPRSSRCPGEHERALESARSTWSDRHLLAGFWRTRLVADSRFARCSGELAARPSLGDRASVRGRRELAGPVSLGEVGEEKREPFYGTNLAG